MSLICDVHDMAFGNQFHMPGSFHFEGPGASTTLNANMFRPPISPSTSTYNLSKSTGSLLSDNSMATNSTTPPPKLGRKRTHDESNSRGFSKLHMEIPRDVSMDDSTEAEHRYTLAGQIETPGAQMTPQGGLLEDSRYSDIDYRRALGSTRPQDECDTSDLRLAGLINPETGEPMTPRTAGWTTFAFQAIGGVVEKVWEFCRGGAGAFRGFQAGGGKAYEFNGQPVPTLSAEPTSPTTAAATDSQECPNSPPGAYPESAGIDYLPNYFTENQQPNVTRQEEKEPSPDTTPERPAAKRRQTGLHHENDELRRNWVMVDEDENGPSPAPAPASAPAPTPVRPAFNARRSSTASSRIPAANRSTMTSRLQQPRFSTPTAPGRKISVPSPRFGGSVERSNIPTRGSSRLSMASPAPASYAGYAGSPSLNAREPASFASPRSPSQASMTNPFTPPGSRIPQPKGLGPNPFANIRTTPTTLPRASPSRPSSRSSLHPSPLHQSFISRVPTPSGHRRSASSISTGSVRGRHSFGLDDVAGVDGVQVSPRLDNEGRQLVTKRFVTERKTDSRLDRLNAELQGLIRQGQQALGTKFDVDMDESWEEDT